MDMELDMESTWRDPFTQRASPELTQTLKVAAKDRTFGQPSFTNLLYLQVLIQDYTIVLTLYTMVQTLSDIYIQIINR